MTDTVDYINGCKCVIDARGGEQADRDKAINLALELSCTGLSIEDIEEQVTNLVTADWFDPSGFNFSIVPVSDVRLTLVK